MSGMLWIDDVDVATLGVIIGREPTGHRDSPVVVPQGQPILGRLGQVDVSNRATADPRELLIAGVQVAETRSALMAKLDKLKLLCGSGVVRLRTGDQPDREWEVVCSVRVGTIGAWLNDVAHNVAFTARALDPVAESISVTNIDFTAGATQCPIGSAISQPLVRVGGVTDPVVTVRDHLGQVVATMGLTAALSGSEWLSIDTELKTITDQAGVQQAPALASGDFLELRPAWAAGLDGPYPTVECSGAPSIAEIVYRRRWL